MAVTLIPKRHNPFEQVLGEFGSAFEYTGFLGASLGLLFLTISLWGGLWWYRGYSHDALEKPRNEALALQEKRNIQEEKDIVIFALSAQTLKDLLESRASATPIFQFLEHRIHDKAVLTEVSFQFSDHTLTLEAVTDGYVSLAEQMVLWENDTNVQNVDVSNFVVNNDGLLSFSATLTLSEALLHEHP